MNDHIANYPDSTAQFYFKLTQEEQWNFMGKIFAFINPFMLVAFAVISTCSCDAPFVDDTPQTFVTNDLCLTTATVWHFRSLALYIAYVTVDTVNCLILQRDANKKMLYFSRFLSVAGACCGISEGGYVAVGWSVGLIAEFSTPFGNLKSIMQTFNETNTAVYINNEILMICSHFIVRCIF